MFGLVTFISVSTIEMYIPSDGGFSIYILVGICQFDHQIWESLTDQTLIGGEFQRVEADNIFEMSPKIDAIFEKTPKTDTIFGVV